MKRAIFLDRDGTLNTLVYYSDTKEYESPRSPEALTLIEGIESALSRLTANDYSLFLVSNQPSYAKGKTSLENLQAVHTRLNDQLLAWGIQLVEAYYCYHHPKGIVATYTMICNCRKPSSESLFKARDTYDINLNESWMIGDQDSDVRCGQNAGCSTILLDYFPSANKRDVTPGLQPNARCTSLNQAVEYILNQ